MRFKTIALFASMVAGVSAQTPDQATLDILHESLSGEIAKEHVIQITRHHRIQGSRGFRNSANYVLEQLRKYGFSEKDAYIESYLSDGKKTYQTWQSPSGWDIESAELRMIEPEDERIVGYPEIAMSVMTYSNAGEATAELVWVGRGTSDADYDGKDVKGKFVLATGYGGSVHRLAVLKYGAKAVVCYLDDDRAKEYPDMLQYTGMWPKTAELPRVTFGFNITNRQGERLKGLVSAGKKVVMKGWVKGIGLESYFMDVVVAQIRGAELPEEELLFSAHLDHPKESANDNASGSAAILDIARSLNELIGSGRLPHPKRSFRFVWVPEFYGTMAWIDAHPEIAGPALGGKFLANMNMDMVGENLELLHSKLILTKTPLSNPSCVNDAVAAMAAAVDNMNVRTPRGGLSVFNYRVIPYSGGSDHMMFNDRKIPAVMFSHDPDYTHHTSEDTPDKVDPVELERCEIISAGTMWHLANMTATQAVDLIAVAAGSAMDGLYDALRRARKIGPPSPSAAVDLRVAQNILDYEYWHGAQSIASVLNYNNAPEALAAAEAATKQLEMVFRDASIGSSGLYPAGGAPAGGATAGASSDGEPGDDRTPVRLTRGPLDSDVPERFLPEAERSWYSSAEFTLSDYQRYELVNFIDGTMTVSAIRDAVSAAGEPVQPVVVSRYIDDLVRAGVVKWK